MELQIPHSALTRYLKTNAKPEKIAECLSLCGPTVDSLEKIENDYLYHIEIITNRVDAASAFGLAREAAVILPEFGYKATLIPPDPTSITRKVNQPSLSPLDIKVQNHAQLNSRIMAIKISNVTISPSPSWLTNALAKYGQRSLNNVIDVTNYIMFELGHPVHVFDYDRLTTKTIIVREAKTGEVFITLDGNRHTTDGGEVVYDDGQGQIIDLPGIMGTQNSVVTDQTVNVLLWIEDNDSLRIRKASLRHQLRTQAAILNEKAVDPELTPTALSMAASLILELSHGQVGSRTYDLYPSPFKAKHINLDPTWLNNFSGIKITLLQLMGILTRLDFHPQAGPGGLITCTIPSYRDSDLSLPEDLAEEVLRIYGYFRLPSVIPLTQLPAAATDPLLNWEYQIRLQLTHLGFTEIYNYSLISETLGRKTKQNLDSAFHLKNPLSQDYVFMRQSLLPSLLKNLQANQSHTARPIHLFELANTYLPAPPSDLASEISTLSLISLGSTYLKLKGYLEAIFKSLALEVSFKAAASPSSLFLSSHSAQITSHGQILGTLGQITPSIAKEFQIHDPIFACELNFQLMAKGASAIHRFKPVSPYPPIIEDLTFTLPEKSPLAPILAALKQSNSLITDVTFKTQYHQNFTFTFQYQSASHSLTDQDIAPIRLTLVNLMKTQFKAALVGELL